MALWGSDVSDASAEPPPAASTRHARDTRVVVAPTAPFWAGRSSDAWCASGTTVFCYSAGAVAGGSGGGHLMDMTRAIAERAEKVAQAEARGASVFWSAMSGAAV